MQDNMNPHFCHGILLGYLQQDQLCDLDDLRPVTDSQPNLPRRVGYNGERETCVPF